MNPKIDKDKENHTRHIMVKMLKGQDKVFELAREKDISPSTKE